MGGFQNIGKILSSSSEFLQPLHLLAVYRVGVHIPTPGIDGQVLASIFEQARGTTPWFF